MKIIGGIRDYAARLLGSTHGEDLQIMANLTHPDQLDLVTMGHYQKHFHSRYIPAKVELYLRHTVSIDGKGRDGMEKIAQTPDYVQPSQQGFGDWVPGEEVDAGNSRNR